MVDFPGNYGEMTLDQMPPDESTRDTRSMHIKAMDRVSQITSISLCFALPIIGGYYIDQWLGTKVVFTILSVFFGMAAAGVQFQRLLRSLNREAEQARKRYQNKNK